MRGTQDSLAALRGDAASAVDRFCAHLNIGRGLGMVLPTDAQIRARLAELDRFDVAALTADSRCLAAAHRVVSEHLHRLPEQQIRLDSGWCGDTASEAVVAVINHQRKAESDLDVLRTMSDATASAASGIDRLMRTFLLTLARLAEPTIAGCPVAELPAAVLTGRVPAALVLADIESRVVLFTTGADAVQRGIGGILQVLDRSTAGLDDEPYFASDTFGPRLARSPAPEAGVTRVDHEHTKYAGKELATEFTSTAATSSTDLPGYVEGVPSKYAEDVPFRLGGTGPVGASRQSPPHALPPPSAGTSPGDLALAGEQ